MGRANEARDGGISVAGRERNKGPGKLGGPNFCECSEGISRSGSANEGGVVVKESKGDIRAKNCELVDRLGNEINLGSVGFQEFEASRDVGKEVFDGDRGALRSRFGGPGGDAAFLDKEDGS